MVNDGGPAFPVPMIPCDKMGGYIDVLHPGMSLRDQFALHADQPGTIEVYQLRGCPETMTKPAGWTDAEWNTNSLGYKAEKYWQSLSLDEKYAAYAELRYRIADAMLKAREVPDAK